MKQIMNFYDKENKKVGYIEFKNFSKDIGEIYIYGQIVSGSEKWEDDDVTVLDFKKKLDDLGDVKTLNIYINSPGGSITAGVNILNILNRHKAIKNVYIDALAASIASVISMCYDNLYLYTTSTLMIHEAMMFMFGSYNKSQLAEIMDNLDRIENSMIIPAYMSKLKDNITEDDIKDMMKKESWLGAKEIQQYFKDVILLNESKDIAACCKDFDILNKYHNTPHTIKSIINKTPVSSNIDHLKAQKIKLELQLY